MELASRAELRNRDLLIEKLKHQLAGLRRQRFGATSETLDQLELGIEDEEFARVADAVPEPALGAKPQLERRPLPVARPLGNRGDRNWFAATLEAGRAGPTGSIWRARGPMLAAVEKRVILASSRGFVRSGVSLGTSLGTGRLSSFPMATVFGL